MARGPRAWQVDQLQHNARIVNPDGTPDATFLQQWNLLLQLVKQVTTLSGLRLSTTPPIEGGGELADNLTISHADSGVTPGSYTNADITVDEFGHVTAAGSGAPGLTLAGAMAERTTNQSLTATISTTAQFTTEVYDDAGFIDLAANNTRITIPSGYNRCIVSAQAAVVTGTNLRFLSILKNGSFTYAGSPNIGSITTQGMAAVTGVLEVSAGDYFELSVASANNNNLNPASLSIVAWNHT